jgi:ankyrin repeat protein
VNILKDDFLKEPFSTVMMHYSRRIVFGLVAITLILVLLTSCVTPSNAQWLMWSVRAGNTSKVEKHIEEGVDVNARNRWLCMTPLTVAVRRGNLQIVTLLIEAGANIHAMDAGCQTPLMTAAAAGDIEMAKFLIKSGANINMSNNCQGVELTYPATALIAASWHGNSEMAQFLIDAGADVHHRDATGDTALDWAMVGEDCRKTLETVVVLVQAGADGQRALRLVRERKYLVDELARILHEGGATNPYRLAVSGDYSEIDLYIDKWIDMRYE